MHYARMRLHGEVGASGPMRRSHKGSAHYSQVRKGKVPGSIRPTERGPCLVCGAPPMHGFREYCSWGCRQLSRTYGGKVPTHVQCVMCLQPIDLRRRSRRGYRGRIDTRICRACRNGTRKHGMSVGQLAFRDGAVCRICLDPVDMNKRRPDRMCPSVDHLGSNDPPNLQLAHLECNWLKSDSAIFQLRRAT